MGFSDPDIEFYLNPENYNSISNLQLLDGNENSSKSASDLKAWVKKESGKQKISTSEFCEKHLFPEILDFEDFQKFIKKRRALLKLKLKAFM